MWTLKPEERLREWRYFRDQIGNLSLEEACNQTSHLWSYAPFVNHRLDKNRTHSLISWPDPWTLLHENIYCDLAKSLGMLYTLYLSKHKSSSLELVIYHYNKQDYNLVQVDKGKYILNLVFDTVVNKEHLPKHLELQYRYTPVDLGLNDY